MEVCLDSRGVVKRWAWLCLGGVSFCVDSWVVRNHSGAWLRPGGVVVVRRAGFA